MQARPKCEADWWRDDDGDGRSLTLRAERLQRGIQLWKCDGPGVVGQPRSSKAGDLTARLKLRARSAVIAQVTAISLSCCRTVALPKCPRLRATTSRKAVPRASRLRKERCV